MEFSKQEYWSGLPFPFPGYLPNPGIKHRSSAFWADSLPSEPLGKPKQLDIHVQKLTLDPYQALYSDINSNWIKDLNIGAKMIKLLEEIIGVNFGTLS